MEQYFVLYIFYKPVVLSARCWKSLDASLPATDNGFRNPPGWHNRIYIPSYVTKRFYIWTIVWPSHVQKTNTSACETILTLENPKFRTFPNVYLSRISEQITNNLLLHTFRNWSEIILRFAPWYNCTYFAVRWYKFVYKNSPL